MIAETETEFTEEAISQQIEACKERLQRAGNDSQRQAVVNEMKALLLMSQAVRLAQRACEKKTTRFQLALDDAQKSVGKAGPLLLGTGSTLGILAAGGVIGGGVTLGLGVGVVTGSVATVATAGGGVLIAALGPIGLAFVGACLAVAAIGIGISQYRSHKRAKAEKAAVPQLAKKNFDDLKVNIQDEVALENKAREQLGLLELDTRESLLDELPGNSASYAHRSQPAQPVARSAHVISDTLWTDRQVQSVLVKEIHKQEQGYLNGEPLTVGMLQGRQSIAMRPKNPGHHSAREIAQTFDALVNNNPNPIPSIDVIAIAAVNNNLAGKPKKIRKLVKEALKNPAMTMSKEFIENVTEKVQEVMVQKQEARAQHGSAYSSMSERGMGRSRNTNSTINMMSVHRASTESLTSMSSNASSRSDMDMEQVVQSKSRNAQRRGSP